MATIISERPPVRPAPPARDEDAAAIEAGFNAGAVYLALQLLLTQLFTTRSGWEPLKEIAAIVLGKGVLAPTPMTAAAGIVGILLHFTLSCLFAWIVARLFLRRRPRNAGELVVGAIAGWALYCVNYYLFTTAFPWFSIDRNGITLFDHWVWGAVVAATYTARARAPRFPQAV